VRPSRRGVNGTEQPTRTTALLTVLLPRDVGEDLVESAVLGVIRPCAVQCVPLLESRFVARVRQWRGEGSNFGATARYCSSARE